MNSTHQSRLTLITFLALGIAGLPTVALATDFDPILAMPGHGGEEGDPLWYRLLKYGGKFHVLVIHFPIAFLLGASAAQWWHVVKGIGGQTAQAMLWLGTGGAVIAASLGWAFAYDSAYFGDSEGILLWHRWLGTSTAVAAVITWALRKKLGDKSLAWALTLLALLVGAAGHYGGSLVRGADYLLKF